MIGSSLSVYDKLFFLYFVAMARLSRKQWILTTAGLVLLGLFLSVGLLVRLRSVAAARQLVKTLSNGTYAMDASAIRVDPVKMKVRIAQLHLYPVHAGIDNNEFQFRTDSMELNLDDVIQLLLFKQLNVESFSLLRPVLELRVYEKDSVGQRIPIPLHQQVSRMQNVFFEVLESLDVKHCDIRQATFAYYPDLNNNESRYFINQVNLSIRDLHLLKKISNWNNDNEVAIRFELQNPQIEYPDSTIKVNLDQLLWDSKQHRFELNGLGFHKNITTIGDSTGFRLEGIELDSLNWNKLLTEGIVELELLKASRGYFSSNDFRIRKKQDSSKAEEGTNLLDILGPIKVKQVAINEINFIGNSHTPRGKETFFFLGNNFSVKDLVVDKNLPNKMSVKELQLKVRAYVESDSSRNFSSGFSEMNINKNDLVLYNYFLQTRRKSRMGNNRIDVKKLTLTNLNIPELLRGRLKADELLVSGTRINLELRKSPKTTARIPWRRIQRAIGRKLDIGTIYITDGNLTITKQGSNLPFLLTDSFTASINGRKLLRAKNLEALLDGNNRLYIPNINLKLNTGSIHLQQVEYKDNGIGAGKAIGTLQNGKMVFELENLFIYNPDAAFIIGNSSERWADSLTIGSGKVALTTGDPVSEIAATKNQQYISHLRTGPLKLILKGRNLDLELHTDTISVDDLRESAGIWNWKDVLLKGSFLRLNHGNIVGMAGHFSLAKGSSNIIHNSHWQLTDDKFLVLLDIAKIGLSHQLKSSVDIMAQLDQIRIRDASAEIHLLPVQAPSDKLEANEKIHLPPLSFQNTEFVVSSHEDGRENRIASLKAILLNTSAINNAGDIWQANSIDAVLKDLHWKFSDNTLNLPEMNVLAENIRWPAGSALSTIINRVSFSNADYHRRAGQNSLSVYGANGKSQEAFYLSTNKDSLKGLMGILPGMDLHLNKMEYVKGKSKIFSSNLRLNNQAKEWGFDSLSLENLSDRDSFFREKAWQTDLIQFSSGPGVLKGLQVINNKGDTTWKAEHLSLKKFHLLVDRDKRYPRDEIRYRPLLVNMLKKLPFRFILDTLELKQSLVRYSEMAEKNGAEGTIYFSEMNAQAINIRNDDIETIDTLTIQATANLMGKGNLSFHFAQPYTNEIQAFHLRANMGAMKLKALTPLLKPLYNLEILAGKTDSVVVDVHANQDLALGSMYLDYSKLKIKLLNDAGEKKAMLSFLGNSILRNNNKKSSPIYQERLADRAIFNYWGKIALSGLLSNMGLQNNRKKISAYQKQK